MRWHVPFLAARRDIEPLEILVNYITSQNYLAIFLEAVIDGQATLVAKWMSVGFIH
ncbi:MAG: hypothetical protein HRT83_02695 [Hyphomicrobiaceae bacterium]|nr:hypothetical protein [Hyphomicrobiaceae bacterium]